jgi:hypothetical protein
MKPSAALQALTDHLEGTPVVSRSADDVVRRIRTADDLTNFPSRDRQMVAAPGNPLPRPSDEDDDDDGNFHSKRWRMGVEITVGYRLSPHSAERIVDDSEALITRLQGLSSAYPTLYVTNIEDDVDAPEPGVYHLTYYCDLHYLKD